MALKQAQIISEINKCSKCQLPFNYWAWSLQHAPDTTVFSCLNLTSEKVNKGTNSQGPFALGDNDVVFYVDMCEQLH